MKTRVLSHLTLLLPILCALLTANASAQLQPPIVRITPIPDDIEVGIGGYAVFLVGGACQFFNGTGASVSWAYSEVQGIPYSAPWGSSSTPPIGTAGSYTSIALPVGTHTVYLIATDSTGLSSYTSTTITVVDTTAPTLSATLSGQPVEDGSSHLVSMKNGPVTIAYEAFDFTPVTVTRGYLVQSGDAQITYNTNTITIEDATVGTSIVFVIQAFDANGNYSQNLSFTVEIAKKIKKEK
jgi:hypothetical protein